MSKVKFGLILANAVPLALVLTGYLAAAEMLIVYWLEAVLMGFFTVVSILFAEGSHNTLSGRLMDIAESSRRLGPSPEKSEQGRSGLIGSLFTAAFFIGKGGITLAFSGVILFGFILPDLPGSDPGLSSSMLDLLLGWDLKTDVDYRLMLKPMVLPFAALALGQAWSFARDFWLRGEGRFFNSGFYSGMGLLRILAVMLTAIFAGFIAGFAGAGAGIYIAAVLVLVKTVFEHQLSAAAAGFTGGEGREGEAA